MNKIDKFLRKLPKHERHEVEKVLAFIFKQQFEGLDIKKLKGLSNVYRVRKGQLRIIYKISDKGSIELVDIDRRNDTTYNF
jgi:mRNA-degrading endonuclease RelE of RelBE toxin-antitoxin system